MNIVSTNQDEEDKFNMVKRSRESYKMVLLLVIYAMENKASLFVKYSKNPKTLNRKSKKQIENKKHV